MESRKIVCIAQKQEVSAGRATPHTPRRKHLLPLFASTRILATLKSGFIKLQLAEEFGLNSELYWENKDLSGSVNLVPVSAEKGDGVADLLFVIVKLTQSHLFEKITPGGDGWDYFFIF